MLKIDISAIQRWPLIEGGVYNKKQLLNAATIQYIKFVLRRAYTYFVLDMH